MATESVSVPVSSSPDSSVVEQVVLNGDLAKLRPQDRVAYYQRVCQSLGLNPFTQPFRYLALNGKLTLYATKDATEQLRTLKGISITALEREVTEGIYVVTAHAKDQNGREDSAVGAVSIQGLGGEARANAMMKAETKSKRRVTLSICGLGWTDESEVESIPGAEPVAVDIATGELPTESVPINPTPSKKKQETAPKEPPRRGSSSALPNRPQPDKEEATKAFLKAYGEIGTLADRALIQRSMQVITQGQKIEHSDGLTVRQAADFLRALLRAKEAGWPDKDGEQAFQANYPPGGHPTWQDVDKMITGLMALGATPYDVEPPPEDGLPDDLPF